MVVVVAALHLRLALHLLHLRPVLHLGMVLVVLMRLVQPAFYACASGFVGRAVS